VLPNTPSRKSGAQRKEKCKLHAMEQWLAGLDIWTSCSVYDIYRKKKKPLPPRTIARDKYAVANDCRV
jgi:hypothetical protein